MYANTSATFEMGMHGKNQCSPIAYHHQGAEFATACRRLGFLATPIFAESNAALDLKDRPWLSFGT